jgi:hypothetical protein
LAASLVVGVTRWSRRKAGSGAHAVCPVAIRRADHRDFDPAPTELMADTAAMATLRRQLGGILGRVFRAKMSDGVRLQMLGEVN